MKGNRHTFWQALVVAVVIFAGGLVLGIMLEQNRADKLERFYFESETDIFDIFLSQQLLRESSVSCDYLIDQSIFFADKIYGDARRLEKYDASNKLTDDVFQLHRRYDLLRIMVLDSILENQEKCGDEFNFAVYLYQYDNPSVETRAKQGVFSKVLLDLKKDEGDKLILIPIAYDTDVQAADILRARYGLEKGPVVLINGEHVVRDLTTAEALRKYLN